MVDDIDFRIRDLVDRDWKSYDHLRDAFEWDIPQEYNIATYICDRWARDDRIALLVEDAGGNERTYTFLELYETANQLANYLVDLGVDRGDRVGVYMGQRPETILSHIAIWKLGAVSVPLSTSFGPDGLHYRLSDCRATVCIVDRKNVENLRSVKPRLSSLDTLILVNEDGQGREQSWTRLEDYSDQFETVRTQNTDDATIVYTSGTTGAPKGVLHAHQIAVGNLPSFLLFYANAELNGGDVFWAQAEWSWIASLFGLVIPALHYGTPVLAHDGERFTPDRAFELIETYGVTNYHTPPTALRAMRESEVAHEYDFDSIRVIATGGEEIGDALIDWVSTTFNAPVNQGYGQTEAPLPVVNCTALMDRRNGATGRASLGHEVTIVDTENEKLEEVNPGEIGEIALQYEGTPTYFKEYWNAPAETGRKVRQGWLLTGDLGKRDQEGYFYFVSRKDDIIISSGYRIGPSEIEASLTKHQAVAEAGVIGIPDEIRGEVPKAYVVVTDGCTKTEELAEELMQYVKSKLARYAYPREVEFLPELPKTSTGKIRRASLRELEELE